MNRIGFGGGCHWCTEAIFQSVVGVKNVDQGWIRIDQSDSSFSEAVIVTYDPGIVQLEQLIHIHLQTHSSSSIHSFRQKYRSAVYVFSSDQFRLSESIIDTFRRTNNIEVITQTLWMKGFKKNKDKYLDYYKNNPDRAFCKTYIKPKLDKVNKLDLNTVHQPKAG